MFKGIVLGQGEVAREVPEIRNHILVADLAQSDEQLEAIRTFNNELVQTIREVRPEYLQSFGNAMRSGDRSRIGRALGNTGSVLLDVVTEMESVKKLQAKLEENPEYKQKLAKKMSGAHSGDGLSTSDFKKVLAGLASGSLDPAATNVASPKTVAVAVAVVAAAIVSTAAVAVNYAVGVNVAAAVNVGVQVNVGLEGSNASKNGDRGLLGEQLVDSIARLYGTA